MEKGGRKRERGMKEAPDDWPVCRNICSCIPDSHQQRITGTKCHINTVVSPDDGSVVTLNMLRLITINILRMNCTSWFYLQDYTEMHVKKKHIISLCYIPLLWSSGQGFWLQIQRSRVRFPALPDFLSGSGSGTGCTQPRKPREVN